MCTTWQASSRAVPFSSSTPRGGWSLLFTRWVFHRLGSDAIRLDIVDMMSSSPHLSTAITTSKITVSPGRGLALPPARGQQDRDSDLLARSGRILREHGIAHVLLRARKRDDCRARQLVAAEARDLRDRGVRRGQGKSRLLRVVFYAEPALDLLAPALFKVMSSTSRNARASCS